MIHKSKWLWITSANQRKLLQLARAVPGLCFVTVAMICCNENKSSQNTDLTTHPSVASQLSVYPFSLPAKAAVTKLLQENPGWRLALTADNRSRDLQNYLAQHPGYTPYFAAGDMTGDKLPDTAVSLIKDGTFAVVWFRGEQNRVSQPQWLTKEGQLDQGGIFPRKDGLLLGNCFDCDNAEYFRWNSQIQQLVVEANSEDSDIP